MRKIFDSLWDVLVSEQILCFMYLLPLNVSYMEKCFI